jgi:hypothetical protein
MNECCQWYWALKEARKPSKQKAKWLREKDGWMAGIKSAYRRTRTHPKRTSVMGSTWHEATKVLGMRAKKRRSRYLDEWRPKLIALANNRKVETPATGNGPRHHASCPDCKPCKPKQEDWINRVLLQRHSRLASARQSDWDRKCGGIAAGNRRRPRSIRIPSSENRSNTWIGGLRDAMQRSRAKARWQSIPGWDRWANNVATNNAKRHRYRDTQRQDHVFKAPEAS